MHARTSRFVIATILILAVTACGGSLGENQALFSEGAPSENGTPNAGDDPSGVGVGASGDDGGTDRDDAEDAEEDAEDDAADEGGDS